MQIESKKIGSELDAELLRNRHQTTSLWMGLLPALAQQRDDFENWRYQYREQELGAISKEYGSATVRRRKRKLEVLTFFHKCSLAVFKSFDSAVESSDAFSVSFNLANQDE